MITGVELIVRINLIIAYNFFIRYERTYVYVGIVGQHKKHSQVYVTRCLLRKFNPRGSIVNELRGQSRVNFH